jgi:hypothetical protein
MDLADDAVLKIFMTQAFVYGCKKFNLVYYTREGIHYSQSNDLIGLKKYLQNIHSENQHIDTAEKTFEEYFDDIVRRSELTSTRLNIFFVNGTTQEICGMNRMINFDDEIAQRIEQSLATAMKMCNGCGNEANLSCPCQKVRYCSKECQKKDWKKHKPLFHNSPQDELTRKIFNLIKKK